MLSPLNISFNIFSFCFLGNLAKLCLGAVFFVCEGTQVCTCMWKLEVSFKSHSLAAGELVFNMGSKWNLCWLTSKP